MNMTYEVGLKYFVCLNINLHVTPQPTLTYSSSMQMSVDIIRVQTSITKKYYSSMLRIHEG